MVDLDLQLRTLRLPDAPLWTIHYACESWYDVKDRPVAISCIALVRVADRASHVFSQTDSKVDPEGTLLDRFFEHLKEHPEAQLVHWNMNSSDFGFEALVNRYRYLFSKEPPTKVPEANKFDLDELIAHSFGPGYADHPKLRWLGDLNGFSKWYMLSGKEESEKFKAGMHGDIRRSTSEKAQLISFLLQKLLRDELLTKNSGISVKFCDRRLDAIRIVEEIGSRMEVSVRRTAS